MRMRNKAVLAVGAVCLATGVFASGALAHGGHREKLGKSSKGTKALKVEVRGTITALTPATAATPGSITISAGAAAGFTWTCAVPAGSDLSRFATTPFPRVKAKCRSTADTGLTLKKLRHSDKGDKVRVEAFGAVTAFTAFTAPATNGIVTVDTGVAGQTPVSCAVTDRTRVKGTVAVTTPATTAKVECKSKNGALVAKKIKVRVPKAKAKGTLVVNGDGSVTVNGVTCANTNNITIPSGITPTTVVEIKCSGNPLVLTKIEIEDHDDD